MGLDLSTPPTAAPALEGNPLTGISSPKPAQPWELSTDQNPFTPTAKKSYPTDEMSISLPADEREARRINMRNRVSLLIATVALLGLSVAAFSQTEEGHGSDEK